MIFNVIHNTANTKIMLSNKTVCYAQQYLHFQRSVSTEVGTQEERERLGRLSRVLTDLRVSTAACMGSVHARAEMLMEVLTPSQMVRVVGVVVVDAGAPLLYSLFLFKTTCTVVDAITLPGDNRHGNDSRYPLARPDNSVRLTFMIYHVCVSYAGLS